MVGSGTSKGALLALSTPAVDSRCPAAPCSLDALQGTLPAGLRVSCEGSFCRGDAGLAAWWERPGRSRDGPPAGQRPAPVPGLHPRPWEATQVLGPQGRCSHRGAVSRTGWGARAPLWCAPRATCSVGLGGTVSLKASAAWSGFTGPVLFIPLGPVSQLAAAGTRMLFIPEITGPRTCHPGRRPQSPRSTSSISGPKTPAATRQTDPPAPAASAPWVLHPTEW